MPADQPGRSFAHRKASAGHVARSVGWLVAGRLSTMMVSLVTTAILARLLTPADFGLMVVALMATSLVASLVDGGFSMVLVQRSAVTAAHVRMALLLATLAATTIAGLLLGVFRALDGPASGPLMVALIALPLRAWCSVTGAVLQREGRFRPLLTATLASAAFGNAVPALTLAWAGFGVWALIVGLLLSSLIEAALTTRAARLPRLDWPPLATARDFAAIASAGGVMQVVNWAALNSANALVGLLFGPAALGLFARGGALINLAKDVLGSSVAHALMPAFSSLQDSPDQQRHAFERSLAAGLPLFATASALIALHAEAVVLIALGQGWRETVPVLQLMACGLLPRVSYKIAETLNMARGSFWAVARRQVVHFGLLAGCALAGSPLGLPGVAAGVVVATTAYYLLALAAAAGGVNTPARLLVGLHAQAATWAGLVGLADVAVRSLAAPLGFWPADILGGAGAVLVALALFLWGPGRLLGVDLGRLRVTALGRLRSAQA